MSDNLDSTPLDVLDPGSTETQDSNEAKQESTEAQGKRDLYADPAFRELQSKAQRAENEAKKMAAELAKLHAEQRNATIAKLTAPERIAYEKAEVEAELQSYKDAEQQQRIDAQRRKDLERFAKISGAPLEALMDAQTLDDAFNIADKYVSAKNQDALDEARDETAAKVYVGGGNRSTPKTRTQVQMDKALADNDTRSYLTMLMQGDN